MEYQYYNNFPYINDERYRMWDVQRSERVGMGKNQMEASGCVKPFFRLITLRLRLNS